MAKDVFSVPVFLIVFRETLETVIIVSVLLAFLKQTLDGPNRDVKVYKKLRRQVRFPPPQFTQDNQLLHLAMPPTVPNPPLALLTSRCNSRKTKCQPISGYVND